MDFIETFSPVIKLTALRVFFTLALSCKWPIHQVDIKNAFLHGDLDEPVYMQQPPGYIDNNCPNHMCHLKKVLYGLRQSSRMWFNKLSEFLVEYGFHCSIADSSLFVHTNKRGTIILLVYVDDILVTGDTPNLLKEFISVLSSTFTMKDLGYVHHFLGIKVIRTGSNIMLCQTRYAYNILEQAGLIDCKPANTPMGECSHSGKTAVFSNPTQYRSLVGSLQYLTFTKPDIVYAVNYVLQFMQQLSEFHFQLVKRILRYIKATIHHGVQLQETPRLELQAYSDADWAGYPLTRCSTTGYCIYLGPNCFSRSAKSSPRLLAPALKLKIVHLLQQPPRLLGLHIFYGTCKLSCPPLPFYTATIVQHCT